LYKKSVFEQETSLWAKGEEHGNTLPIKSPLLKWQHDTVHHEWQNAIFQINAAILTWDKNLFPGICNAK
jgi:hypothetical protein